MKVAVYKKHGNAVYEGRARAERNKGIHIRRFMYYALKSADKKPAVNDYNYCRKYKLNNTDNQMVFGRQRQIPEHMPH